MTVSTNFPSAGAAYDAHSKPDTANGKIGGNEGPPACQDRVREIELETRLSNCANDLMRQFDQRLRSQV